MAAGRGGGSMGRWQTKIYVEGLHVPRHVPNWPTNRGVGALGIAEVSRRYVLPTSPGLHTMEEEEESVRTWTTSGLACIYESVVLPTWIMMNGMNSLFAVSGLGMSGRMQRLTRKVWQETELLAPW